MSEATDALDFAKAPAPRIGRHAKTKSLVEFDSAPAPCIGRHGKTKSLVEFDPLLQDDKLSNKLTPNSRASVFSTCVSTSATLENKSSEGERAIKPANQDEVAKELRNIAGQLANMSPRSTSSQSLEKGISQMPSPKQSLPRMSQSPPRRTKASIISLSPKLRPKSLHEKPLSAVGGSNNIGSSAHQGPKFPWQKQKKHAGHLKSQSLDSADGATNNESSTLSPGQKETFIASSNPAASPSMVQDFWSLQMQEQQKHKVTKAADMLAMPNLAKLKPTSFLTGREAVLEGQEDAKWQVDIPPKVEFDVACKLTKFLETYYKEECPFDLNRLVGCSRVDLNMFAAGNVTPATAKFGSCHRPIVELFLECGNDLQGVRGYFLSSNRQALVVERQNRFLCVFTGTEAEQQNKISKQPGTVSLKGLSEKHNVTVFADRYAASLEFESDVFGLLDVLAEENPFCDIVFCGHAFGAAMALLAAYRYALAHHELRCAALVTGTPKVGLEDFRLSVHSLPNLKVMRMEYGRMQSTPCVVGHCIRIHPSSGQVKAYKFGDGQEVSGVRSLFKRDKSVIDYARALEDLDDCKQPWVANYYRRDGAGVRGQDNEERQMT